MDAASAHGRGRHPARFPCAPLAVALIGVAAWATVSTAQAQEANPDAAVQRVFARPDYQRDLPDTPRPGAATAPESTPPGVDPAGAPPDQRPAGPPADASGDTALRRPAAGSSFWFWCIAGLVLAAGLLWLFNAWRNASIDVTLPADRPQPSTDATPVTAPPPADAFRRQAQDAAHAGDFVSAVHLLLLGGLSHVTGAPLEDACTSRERLADTPEGSDQRVALGVLVRTVEEGLFGGRPVDRAAFESCVASYDDLLRAPVA